MQTISSEQNKKNYWMQYAEKTYQNQHLFSKTPYLTADFDITLYEESFNATSSIPVPAPGLPPIRTNDDIEYFSKNSRSRLIKYFSTIQLSKYCYLNFVTLTFHNDFPTDGRKIKRWLDNYLKKIRRSFPDLHYLWRLEIQERGAPHFHFIFLSTYKMKGISNEKLSRGLRKLFYESKDCNCHHCLNHGFDFIQLDNPKKAFCYVSKYCAKTNPETNAVYSGRKWGYRGTIFTAHVEQITLRGYQFIYFKKLLRDYYRETISKRTYLDSNLNSFFSFYLICHTVDIRTALIKSITTDIKIIYNELKASGVIDKTVIYDEDNCFLYEFVKGIENKNYMSTDSN